MHNHCDKTQCVQLMPGHYPEMNVNAQGRGSEGGSKIGMTFRLFPIECSSPLHTRLGRRHLNRHHVDRDDPRHSYKHSCFSNDRDKKVPFKFGHNVGV
ncbi:hypothetical protein PAXRUDRAFT_234864 [Paxillus rubicundulus Ve08.2h10]|uniref:Uncharacterized protein n=1 Tax=Paxillus rubicundulus Ve08.2h10 TaxID=930991 RepID=A0A0D0DP00_9AGAM|nr:hypothetical protein PAXRUDRAFT_234864 [Paxillus rubicundulus Ve08.2h10]